MILINYTNVCGNLDFKVIRPRVLYKGNQYPNSNFDLGKRITESTGPDEGHSDCALTIQQTELQGSLYQIKTSPENMAWCERFIPAQIPYSIFMFINIKLNRPQMVRLVHIGTWLNCSPNHGLRKSSACAFQTNPGSCGSSWASQRSPYPLQPGCVCTTQRGNNKHNTTALPEEAAWAKQGAGIPNFPPYVSRVPGATRQAGEGAIGKEKPPLPAPSKGGAPCTASLPQEQGGTLERMELPRAGCPGGAGSSEPRGTRRYL